MPRVHRFNVTPVVPQSLAELQRLAYDLTWSWVPQARQLFRRVDPKQWQAVGGNPVALLGQVSPARLAQLSTDRGFLEQLAHVAALCARERRTTDAWLSSHLPQQKYTVIAYFCAEYGLTEALPIYSGGLGVLAGDHLKSASNLGLPLVAIGLAYQEGYFHQVLNHEGWQHENPYDNDFGALPMRRARRPDGQLASVDVHIEGRRVEVLVWQVDVGQTRLFLLDTNSAANTPADRDITYRLYGGGREYRCAQEIVLGMGGFYTLQALGLAPSVYHMNEGHSAFMALARIRSTMDRLGVDFHVAREVCAATNVFTTHTPVPAGFDIFSRELLARFLPDVHATLGLDREAFLALGAHEDDPGLQRGFNMAYLALRLSGWVNGVSQLHAKVSRGMWQRLWPGRQVDEVPIQGVTNGIHIKTWLNDEMGALFDRYLGAEWRADAANPATWEAVDALPNAELWHTKARARERLVSFVRQRAAAQALRLGRDPGEVAHAGQLLDPNALTIGFARRFATYKRATLMLREPERLRRLLTNDARPVQFVFAGKAHPQDFPAKELIKTLVQFSRDPVLKRRIVFLEEYDMGVARKLVQGVDVWLNNPRRPKEASGTSGMKVVANGGLNLSVLDGWWAEAYDGTNGWAIGAGELYQDAEAGDVIEARLLLDLLESRVVPAFYDRGQDGLPGAWLARMKASMGGLTAFFSSDRMLQNYAERLYFPAAAAGRALVDTGYQQARVEAARMQRLSKAWSQVRVGEPSLKGTEAAALGAEIDVGVDIFLGEFEARDVFVEVVGGTGRWPRAGSARNGRGVGRCD